ncbi:AmmeMemoRadiSam system protein B [Allostella humosa]|uniref:AmmeMemoRadiSam system protein B n=1 Tax=Stella humosa TaxID=94 RepID=UPI0014774527|nr:AmmeMemoRadiSam system protein B [Stella humosa]
MAGVFYPAERAVLAELVVGLLRGARCEIAGPKAVIAPHAGLAYSGAIAATAYRALAANRGTIKRVVLVGPTHRMGVKGIALPRADAFATPLGEIPVDWPAMAPLLAMPDVAVDDRPFEREHSLEVHLPFIQAALGPVTLIPMLASAVTPERVEAALAAVWGGPETAIIVSSDLSHFHDHETASGFDRACSKAIELLKAEDIGDHQACGRTGIKGLIRMAQRLDMRATTVGLGNSGDTGQPRDRVVGYGAYVFEQAGTARLHPERQGFLLDVARRSIRRGITAGKPIAVQIGDNAPPTLTAHRATFVTLEQEGRLRGCIGSVIAHRPLVEDVAENAFKAAFGDPRFPKLTLGELARCHLSVAILSTPRPIACASEEELVASLRPHLDGVILQDRGRRGLFLPHVWSGLPDRAQFVRQLKAKAGLPRDHWSPTMRAWRFGTEKFAGDLAPPAA